MKCVPLVLACAALSACALIDQNTFAPSPEAEPIPAARAAARPLRIDPRAPLVVVDYAARAPNYRDLLHVAVRAAETRYGQVEYDVVAATPTLATSLPPEALEMMRAIQAEGVPATRIHLGLRAEPALGAMQMRVYVR